MKSLLTKKQVKECFDESIQYQKKEDLRIKRLIKNFTPTKLEKVLKCLKKIDIMDDEDICYNNIIGITLKEYSETLDYLRHKYVINFKNSKYDRTDQSGEYMFPDYRAFFQYKKIKFIMRRVSGQGTTYQLLTLKAQDKKWPSKKFPMKFEEENKIIIKFDKEEND